MRMQMDNFDHSDQLGSSISIYHINLNEFQQRMKEVNYSMF
jgi:hypothetical protein